MGFGKKVWKACNTKLGGEWSGIVQENVQGNVEYLLSFRGVWILDLRAASGAIKCFLGQFSVMCDDTYPVSSSARFLTDRTFTRGSIKSFFTLTNSTFTNASLWTCRNKITNYHLARETNKIECLHLRMIIAGENWSCTFLISYVLCRPNSERQSLLVFIGKLLCTAELGGPFYPSPNHWHTRTQNMAKVP